MIILDRRYVRFEVVGFAGNVGRDFDKVSVVYKLEFSGTQ